MSPPASTPILELRDLAISFEVRGGPRVQAVDGASFTLYPRQTLAVVGESGCGKSVTAMSLLHLIPRPPGRFDRGTARFRPAPDAKPIDLLACSERDIRTVRGAQIAMIFQEPMTSLNPVYTIGDQIIEAILLHQPEAARGNTARDIALQALRDVGITEAERRLNAYPHQFSGGMRQRVMIAMALACRPALLVADEPTTALDVTIQAQILELMRDLQHRRGMAILLITHALGVVAENADVVCVMYAGRVVEYARVFDLFDKPLHPYTRGLMASIPTLRTRESRLTTIRQIVDDPAQFTQLSGHERGIRPWWPTHDAPPGSPTTTRPGGESLLVPVAPDHWVALWDTPAGRALAGPNPPPPDLDFRVPVSADQLAVTPVSA